MLDMLRELSEIDGASGDEGAVRDYIISKIKGFCEYHVDNIGNLIAFKKGKKSAEKKVMLSAHMDEVGLIITNIAENGYLKFSTVGGIDPRVIFGRRVRIGKNKVRGVIGGVPIHLLSSSERGNVPSVSEMCIDIGAVSREEAEAVVKLGDTAVFDTGFERFGFGLVKGKALDDRAGCAILIDIIKGEIEYDTYFTFVVQEEIGLRGAKCAAYSVDPDFAVVVESTTAADIHGVSADKQVCKVGAGAVISFMDGRTVYDRGMYNAAFDMARERNIALQSKQAVAGGNDAGAIHTSRSGVRTLAVSLACRYLHAPAGVISILDMQSAKNIVMAMAEKAASGEL